MRYDVTKIVPHKVEGEYASARLEFNLRWEVCKKMKEIDPDVNFYSIRPLSQEFMNFIDGKRTIYEIATAVGYEYGFKINGEHVLQLFNYFKEKGLLTFSKNE